MTPAEATKELADMMMTVDSMQSIKGKAALSRKIRGCMDFLKRYKTGNYNIPALMVRECSEQMENLNQTIGEHQQSLKGIQR